MNAQVILLLTIAAAQVLVSPFALGQEISAERWRDWRGKADERFTDSEETFKKVMQKLLEKHFDKNLTKDDLYRAATSGMLEALNSEDGQWNRLYSPSEYKNLQTDLSGQVSGIGIALKFDESSGNGIVLNVIPNTPGARAGVQKDDQILSVDGKRFKGKPFRELVDSIRGQAGLTAKLKILREDKILALTVKREQFQFKATDLKTIDSGTSLLTISYFNKMTPELVAEALKQVNQSGVKKLIVDLRDNGGGGFDETIKVAELFLAKGATIASTRDREGKIEKFQSNGGLLAEAVKLVVLANKGTHSGAELLVSVLKEGRGAKVIGQATDGKWNMQTVEELTNRFAIKYTVKTFASPLGNSFQGSGFKPDFEVPLNKEISHRELASKYDITKRLTLDTQLKAAFEISQL